MLIPIHSFHRKLFEHSVDTNDRKGSPYFLIEVLFRSLNPQKALMLLSVKRMYGKIALGC